MPETIKLSRSEQSRINGAKSRGPTSSAGKAISSCNAIKHGFAASVNVVLGIEDVEEFHEHVAGARSAYRPRDYAEKTFVDQIAAIQWRQSRLQATETGLIDAQVGIQNRALRAMYPEGSEDGYFHLVKAWQAISHPLQKSGAEDHDPSQPANGYDVTSMALLQRYEGSLSRELSRTMTNLHLYRKYFAPSQPQVEVELKAPVEPQLAVQVKAQVELQLEAQPEVPAPAQPTPTENANSAPPTDTTPGQIEPEVPPPPPTKNGPTPAPKPALTLIQPPRDAKTAFKPAPNVPGRLVTLIKKR